MKTCPNCSVSKGRKQFTPAQWTSDSGVCRHCNGGGNAQGNSGRGGGGRAGRGGGKDGGGREALGDGEDAGEWETDDGDEDHDGECVDGAKAKAGTAKVIVSTVVVFDAGEYEGRASTHPVDVCALATCSRVLPTTLEVRHLCTDHKS